MKVELSKEQPKEMGDYKVQDIALNEFWLLWAGEITMSWTRVVYWYEK